MAKQISPDPSADEGLDKVDRGQRVVGETDLVYGRDGKERARHVRPKRGDLPADMNDGGPTATPKTTEDAVETPPRASSWEAIEDDAGDPATPDRRGRDPAETQAKSPR
jgi:hypothetical protein